MLQESDFTTDADGALIPKEGIVTLMAITRDIHYLDMNGDKAITADDRTIMGSSEPKLNYFANFSLKWKTATDLK